MRKLLIASGIMLASVSASADTVQQFKNPTFSGQGWASHVLTLEQMRQGAQQQKDGKAASEKAAAEAAAANTPLAKFMSLFTGQVYSQLATQLTNNLFKECTGNNCLKGDFLVSDTQQIAWLKDTTMNTVTLTVWNGKKDSSGNFVKDTGPAAQIITVPISSFSF